MDSSKPVMRSFEIFAIVCFINCRTNNRVVGDLRPHDTQNHIKSIALSWPVTTEIAEPLSLAFGNGISVARWKRKHWSKSTIKLPEESARFGLPFCKLTAAPSRDTRGHQWTQEFCRQCGKLCTWWLPGAFRSWDIFFTHTIPDSKVHVAHMGPTWGRQDPGGPHVGPMNLLSRISRNWIYAKINIFISYVEHRSQVPLQFKSRVTFKSDVWTWKTIGHLFYATLSFVHHFVAIGEFKLELQYGNAQFGSNSTIFSALWPWDLTDDLEKQYGTSSMLLQALCIIS